MPADVERIGAALRAYWSFVQALPYRFWRGRARRSRLLGRRHQVRLHAEAVRPRAVSAIWGRRRRRKRRLSQSFPPKLERSESAPLKLLFVRKVSKPSPNGDGGSSPDAYRERRRCRVGISTYALGVVGALTVASCVALGIGLALNRRGRPRKISGHTPGGRVLSPTASNGLWIEGYGRVGTPSNTARPDERGRGGEPSRVAKPEPEWAAPARRSAPDGTPDRHPTNHQTGPGGGVPPVGWLYRRVVPVIPPATGHESQRQLPPQVGWRLRPPDRFLSPRGSPCDDASRCA
jgi:hypothetical protein